MNLCPKCGSSPLPFLMVLLISSLGAFTTWLTLIYSEASLLEGIGGSLLVFLGVGATLLHYVFSCMRRHCRHRPEAVMKERHAPHTH